MHTRPQYPHYNPALFGVKANGLIKLAENASSAPPTTQNITQVHAQAIKTMTSDIKVLLEEHNKIMKNYEDTISDLNERIKALEVKDEVQKNELLLKISNVKESVKSVIRSSPKTTPKSTPPQSPTSTARIEKVKRLVSSKQSI